MIRPLLVGLALLVVVPSASATFPEFTLEEGIFNYNDPLYMSDYFSSGTGLSFTTGSFPNNTTFSTGLNGFSAASDQIVPIPGFTSGDNVPLTGQNLQDLFPATPPPGLEDVWANNSISADGSFNDGFSQFSVQQRRFAHVDQNESGFIDAFVEAKVNAPFQVASEAPMVDANFSINLDSAFLGFGDLFLSEGVAVQILNITDPDNVTLMNEVSGFFGQFGNDLDASFFMGDTDLTDNFSVVPAMEEGAPNEALFSYDMLVQLDPTQTYAINVQSDSSTSVDGPGLAVIDSSNTLDVSLQLIDPNARFLIPGTSLVPEPTTACLLLLGLLGLGARRHGGRS